ncbi:Plasmodium exported protein, unknown function [Plasmodium vivax]|uniref:Variable surface protein n=1 Tax=Plasmodium vivax TaxID=5855 RepID=A0A565A4Z8_PLAVI|nr:Plasmodium exported protein, unknown function [Plasmodium vivax]
MNTLFKYNNGINLEKLYNVERNSNITFQRSLAKYVPKTELDRSNTRAKLLENNMYSNVKRKLECYCEKSIFDKIDYIENLAEKMQNNKKSFIKKVLGKYSVGILLFSLFPITGILFPILFGSDDDNNNAIISFCHHTAGTHDPSSSSYEITADTKKLLEGMIPTIKNIFYYVLPIIVILVIIYIFVKVLKYERLRSGKDKMSIKEYCSLCKDIF